jgi:ribose-phosphate pyrophosphokinase
VFPDAGAGKRYGKILAPNILIGSKKRDFTTGTITGLDLIGHIDTTYGKKAIIVDDLSSYGTTFVETSKALREKGVEKVYLLVAHAENSVFKPHPATKVLLLDHIDHLYTTDTILTDHKANWNTASMIDKVTVYDIEEVLKDA